MKGNKSKKVLLVLMAIVMVLVFGGQCLAVETTEKVTVTKKVETTDGTVTLIVSNLKFEAGKNYEYTISKTEAVQTNAIFKDLSMDYSKKQAEISIESKSYYTNDKEYLIRKTNTAYLFIREKDSKNYILEKEKLDLELPLKYACDVELQSNDIFEIKGTYESTKISYNFEKIEDNAVIEKYQKEKNSNNILDSLTNANIPDNGWRSVDAYYSYDNSGYIYEKSYPADSGLYILWIKLQADGNKVVYGAWIYDNLSAEYKPTDDEKKEPTEQEPTDKNQEEQKPQEQTPTNTSKEETTKKDDGKDETITTAKKIPQTGEKYGIFVIAGVVVLAGAIGIVRYKKYKGI